jgi:hypothetical protein
MKNEPSPAAPTVRDALYSLAAVNEESLFSADGNLIGEHGAIPREKYDEVGDLLVVFAVNEVRDVIWDADMTLDTPVTAEMVETGIDALDRAIDDLERGREALHALLPKVKA